MDISIILTISFTVIPALLILALYLIARKGR
jgi:hypothetical protein